MLRRLVGSVRPMVSGPRRGLEEFQSVVAASKAPQEVVVGGEWKAWMLREKSTDDLHKLWYVLLKERNALLTEQAACKQRNVQMPNPTRKKKVKNAMARIKLILHERSMAYKAHQARKVAEKNPDTLLN